MPRLSRWEAEEIADRFGVGHPALDAFGHGSRLDPARALREIEDAERFDARTFRDDDELRDLREYVRGQR